MTGSCLSLRGRAALLALFCLVLCCLAAPSARAAQAVGWLEAVVFPEQKLRLVAKLDTGAKTSALDAEGVELFERDGAQWARFGLRKKRGQGEARRFEARVVGERRIRAAVGRETRKVVDLWVCVAGEKRRVLFTLGSRGQMNYRVILGRRALEGRLLVDSARKFTVDPGCAADE